MADGHESDLRHYINEITARQEKVTRRHELAMQRQEKVTDRLLEEVAELRIDFRRHMDEVVAEQRAFREALLALIDRIPPATT